jgi:hypothetical protein
VLDAVTLETVPDLVIAECDEVVAGELAVVLYIEDADPAKSIFVVDATEVKEDKTV